MRSFHNKMQTRVEELRDALSEMLATIGDAQLKLQKIESLLLENATAVTRRELRDAVDGLGGIEEFPHLSAVAVGHINNMLAIAEEECGRG